MEEINGQDGKLISVVVPTTGDAVGRLFANLVKRVPLVMKHNVVFTIRYLRLALPAIVLAAMAMLAGAFITAIMPKLSLLGLARHLEDAEHA